MGVPIPKKQGMGKKSSHKPASHVHKKSVVAKKTAEAKASPATGNYPPLLIGPGDLLTINVVGYEHNTSSASDFTERGQSTANPNASLPTQYMVDTEGRIRFPFIGVVNLSGLTPIEAGAMLMEKLRPDMKFPQVIVLITQTNTYNISVLGDVARPGQYMIRGQPNLVSMVALAGGPDPDADLGGVLITHGTEKIKANLGRLLNDKNYHGAGPTVYPGDFIFVPKSAWPSLGEWAIVASILASGAILATQIK